MIIKNDDQSKIRHGFIILLLMNLLVKYLMNDAVKSNYINMEPKYGG